MTRFCKYIALVFSFLTMIAINVFAGGYEIDLKGSWKFKIGDNMGWAEPDFNDSSWNSIKAPGNWEDQGYRGYDGYAWYRKKFTLDKTFSDQELMLYLGYVDDVDEVYINGEKIGQSGTFPPQYWSAYSANRKYLIPRQTLKFGAVNMIAVRVYDSQLGGGIVDGDLKIVSQGKALAFDIELSGTWQFNKGKTIIPEMARNIMVPGNWENQGLKYDGFAVCSKWIEVPQKLINERLVLLAGRIDDEDEVYINGQLVGSTGNYAGGKKEGNYAEFRNYFLPPGTLKPGKNLIEIKIFDEYGEGGIVQGPIGIITQAKFREYWRGKRIKE